MEPVLTDKGMELTFKGRQLTNSGAMLVKKEQMHVYNVVPSICAQAELGVCGRQRRGNDCKACNRPVSSQIEM
jgi:hypothetical protein